MKYGFLFLFFALSPLLAEEIYLTCTVTQIAASQKEGQIDTKLKKMEKFIQKDDSLSQFSSFKYLGKKTLNATKEKLASMKLKNGQALKMKPVSVLRAHRKNTITLDLRIGNEELKKRIIDRNSLFVRAGSLPKSAELVLAFSCPVFP
ncbi:MAG TPA: hypothetical protein PLY93_15065 [Turneriella sp.]|nr:hypothetical protein [Turneriella sp.]